MSSPLDRIALLAEWLAESRIDELELTGPGGRVLLRRNLARIEALPPAPPAKAGDKGGDEAALTVASPGVGTLRRAHPLHEEPLACEGADVEAGQPLALLQVGPLLMPVPAPETGTVARILAEDGALVGFGDPLFVLSPRR